MAKFNTAVITNKGKALIAKAQQGTVSIQFSKIATGNGSYTGTENLEAATELLAKQQEFPISNIEITNDTQVVIKAAISNIDLDTGYYIKEIGLYAVDPDEGVILYSITTAVANQWDYLPAYDSLNPATIYLDIASTVANASTVTLKAGSGAYALAEVVDAALYKAALTKNLYIYVSAVTGNNTTGDGSYAKPYRTITKALSLIPKNLNGFSATISVDSGTYLESVEAIGYNGGTLSFMFPSTNDVSIIGSVSFKECQYVRFTNSETAKVKINKTDGVGLLVGYSTNFSCSMGVAIEINSGEYRDAFEVLHNSCATIDSTLTCNNAFIAVNIDNNSRAFIRTLAGTGNTKGIYLDRNSNLGCITNTLVATTPKTISNGSFISREIPILANTNTVTEEGYAADARQLNPNIPGSLANTMTINYGTCTTYSASATYAVGALVIYNNRLYRCTTAITVAEAWTASHWTAVTDANNGMVYNTTDTSFYGVRGADAVAKKLGSSLLAYAEGTAVTTITVPNDITKGILIIRGAVANTAVSVNAGSVEIIDSNTLSATVQVSSASFGVYNPVTYQTHTAYTYERVVRLSDIPKNSIITLSQSNSYLLFS